MDNHIDPLASPELQCALAFARARESYPAIPSELLLELCNAAWERAAGEVGDGLAVHRFEHALDLVARGHRAGGGRLSVSEVAQEAIPMAALRPYTKPAGVRPLPFEPVPEEPEPSARRPLAARLARIPMVSPAPVGATLAAGLLGLAVAGKSGSLPVISPSPAGSEGDGANVRPEHDGASGGGSSSGARADAGSAPGGHPDTLFGSSARLSGASSEGVKPAGGGAGAEPSPSPSSRAIAAPDAGVPPVPAGAVSGPATPSKAPRDEAAPAPAVPVPPPSAPVPVETPAVALGLAHGGDHVGGPETGRGDERGHGGEQRDHRGDALDAGQGPTAVKLPRQGDPQESGSLQGAGDDQPGASDQQPDASGQQKPGPERRNEGAPGEAGQPQSAGDSDGSSAAMAASAPAPGPAPAAPPLRLPLPPRSRPSPLRLPLPRPPLHLHPRLRPRRLPPRRRLRWPPSPASTRSAAGRRPHTRCSPRRARPARRPCRRAGARPPASPRPVACRRCRRRPTA